MMNARQRHHEDLLNKLKRYDEHMLELQEKRKNNYLSQQQRKEAIRE